MKHLLPLSVCVFLTISLHPALARVRAALVVGAPEEMVREDLNDPYVQSAANFAVLELNNLSKGKKARVLVNVAEGTTQVCQ